MNVPILRVTFWKLEGWSVCIYILKLPYNIFLILVSYSKTKCPDTCHFHLISNFTGIFASITLFKAILNKLDFLFKTGQET